MFCVIALIVFAILGIFSASHRILAKEALECVFRRVTFRPCDTGFKEKMQAKLLGKIMGRSVSLAKFVNHHFELLSWIFFVLMIASTIYSVRGGYNYYMYGNCNGLNDSGFCVFDPTGANNKTTPIAGAITESCSTNTPEEKNLTLASLQLDQFPQQQPQASKSLVFIGCYSCDYTRKTYPLIQELLKNNPDTLYTFIHFPVKSDTVYLSNYDYCTYQQDPNKFWQFNDKLFASTITDIVNPAYADQVAKDSGYNINQLQTCLNNPATQIAVDEQFRQVAATGIYGTPTIFVNGESVVGPKPYRVYQRLLNGGILSELWDYLKR